MTDHPNNERIAASRRRLERLAWLLDGAIPIPGTRFRFGIEPIIGLIPVVGDALGLLLGAAILYESVRAGAPPRLILRMLGNSALDALGGLLPGIGDLFDFAFRSNRRNARLLTEHLDARERAVRPMPPRHRALALLLVTLALAALIALLFFGLRWLWA
jgi:hypothetical protein